MKVGHLTIFILDAIFWFWYAVILARVVLSWLRLSPRHPINKSIGPFVYAVTEPILRPIRKALSGLMANSPLDFSPLIAYLLIEVIRTVVFRILRAG